MKVFINRNERTGPWGGGANWVNAFFRFAPQHGITIGTRLNQTYDAIMMVDPRPDELGVGLDEIIRFKTFQPKTKVFQRVNECDARKGEKSVIDPLLLRASEINDFTFFVSDWMRDYHKKNGWKCLNNEVVYNGVDKTVFCKREKLNNGKTNIVTHHWSDNPYKGMDVHEWLDNFVATNPKFTYTYIGRHQNKFAATKHIEPLWGEELGKELGKYDVYVTGTVSDPGPNHILESLSCGLPTYSHIRGGGAAEFVGDSHVYSTVEELRSFLETPEKNLWTPDNWETCIARYVNKMKEVTG